MPRMGGDGMLILSVTPGGSRFARRCPATCRDERGGRFEIKVPRGVGEERDGDARDPQERPLDSGGHGPRIGDVLLAEVGPEVHSRKDEIGPSRQEALEGQIDAVRGRSVHGEDARPDL